MTSFQFFPNMKKNSEPVIIFFPNQRRYAKSAWAIFIEIRVTCQICKQTFIIAKSAWIYAKYTWLLLLGRIIDDEMTNVPTPALHRVYWAKLCGGSFILPSYKLRFENIQILHLWEIGGMTN
jgi:hypothetical protein